MNHLAHSAHSVRNVKGNTGKKKQATNLSLSPEILKWAEKIRAKRHYSSLSVLVEELIRERYDKVFSEKCGESEPSEGAGLGKSSSSSLRYPPHNPQFNETKDAPEKKKGAA